MPEQSAEVTARRLKRQRSLLKAAALPEDTIVDVVWDELALFGALITRVRVVDPDFLVGYEIQKGSFGFLIGRGEVLKLNVLQELSRVPKEKPSRRNDYDVYAEEHESGLFVTGRCVLNIWRRMRAELKLSGYSRENVAWNLLNVRIPHYSHEQLSRLGI